MLSIITGRAKSGKTSELLNLLKKNSSEYKESLLFVPEQFSFSAEKLILNNLNDNLNKVTVVSFSSFCNEIKRLYGGNAGKIINDGARMLFISKAIKQLEGELQLFKSSAAALNSIESIVNAVSEFKQTAIDYNQLMSVSLLYKNTVLGMKLHDIALIMSTYDALIKNVYLDPIDDLTLTYNTIKNNGYFKDKAVYFDSFSGFSGQQYNVIRQALIDSSNVNFTFCTDNKENEFGVFSNVNSTVEKIVLIAQSVGVNNINKIHLNKAYFSNNSIFDIEKCVSENLSDSIKVATENVNIKSAVNKYDELEYIAGEIRRLVRTEGYSFKDFAVITGNPNEYISAVKPIFKKLDVPIFVNSDMSLMQTPVAKFIIFALRAAKSYKSDDIIKLLKTGLTDFSQDDIAELDAYAFLWSLKPSEWENEWTKNPYGLREVGEEKLNNKLAHSNSLREKVIKIVSELKFNKNNTIANICRKIVSVLSRCNISKNLCSYVNQIRDKGDYNYAQFITSSWEAIMSVLDNIVDCYGEDELSLAETIDILERCFNYYKISGIPQGLDEVLLISANRAEISEIKVGFVFGLNFGEFPLFNTDSGLFNVTERGKLIGNNIDISDTYISSAIDENFGVYKALTSATDKLYITYHSSDYKGSLCEPSLILQQILKRFSIVAEPVSLHLAETKAQAFSNLAEKRLPNNVADYISDKLNSDTFWHSKLSVLDAAVHIDNGSISAEVAKRLYSDNSSTSASKIEFYHKCPYAYFLKFGLNFSKSVPIDFKRMQRGEIVHYVLENFIQKDLENFACFTEDDIRETINKYINEYISKKVGKTAVLDEYSKYVLKRILDLLIDLVPIICDELINSEFKPQEFELDLFSKDIKPIISENGSDTLRLKGFVDRVDSYEEDGKKYIRIVDYKTGGKKIKLADILYGLNLQMFVYLSAICTSEKYNSEPAGVLYQPIDHIIKKGPSGNITNLPKVSAVLINDLDILKHMDPNNQYMPYKVKSDGTIDKRSLCISDKDFKYIFNFVKDKIIEMNNALFNGNIAKDPCDLDSNHKTCSYCDYRAICRRRDDEISKVVENLTTDEVLEIIRKGQSDGN